MIFPEVLLHFVPGTNAISNSIHLTPFFINDLITFARYSMSGKYNLQKLKLLLKGLLLCQPGIYKMVKKKASYLSPTALRDMPTNMFIRKALRIRQQTWKGHRNLPGRFRISHYNPGNIS